MNELPTRTYKEVGILIFVNFHPLLRTSACRGSLFYPNSNCSVCHLVLKEHRSVLNSCSLTGNQQFVTSVASSHIQPVINSPSLKPGVCVYIFLLCFINVFLCVLQLLQEDLELEQVRVNSLTHMVVVVDETSGDSATAALESKLQVRVHTVTYTLKSVLDMITLYTLC